ncbi:MAG: hypothetical protein QM831_25775 [Kofleriaceae bacterium]
MHDGDLKLAARVVAGEQAALREFEDGALRDARGHLIARGFPAWLADEAIQQVRIALVVDGAIARYAGRGTLAAFVRVVAVRFALKIQPRDVELEELAADAPTPELVTLKATYGPVVRDAMKTAWRELPAHDRFMLSLELHRKMSIGEIAALYQIHNVSAARKLARSRGVFLDAVRARLATELRGSLDTVDSVLRLISFPASPSDLA